MLFVGNINSVTKWVNTCSCSEKY